MRLLRSVGVFCALIGSLVNRLTKVNLPLSLDRLRALLETTHFSCKKLECSGFKHPQETVDGLNQTVHWYLNQRL